MQDVHEGSGVPESSADNEDKTERSKIVALFEPGQLATLLKTGATAAIMLTILTVAWWCGRNNLPFLEIMGDLSLNVTALTVLLITFFIVVTLFVLFPRAVRIGDAYAIKEAWDGEEWFPYEKAAMFRAEIIILMSSFGYAAFNFFLAYKMFPEGFLEKKGDLDYASCGLWIASSCLLVVMLIWQIRSQNKDVLIAYHKARALWPSASKFTIVVFLLSYKKRHGLRPIPTELEDVINLEDMESPSEYVNFSIEFDDIFSIAIMPMIALLDFFYMFSMAGLGLSAASERANPPNQTDAIIMAGLFAIALPIMPPILLGIVSAVPSGKNLKSVVMSVVAVFLMVILAAPTAATVLNRVAYTLNFGGDKPVRLYVVPTSACSHPELFEARTDCASTVPVKTEELALAWLGPGKVIVHLTGIHAGKIIVLDRRDVSSIDIILERRW